MKVHSFRALDTNYIYLLEKNKRAIIFDPGEASPVIQKVAELGLTPEAIWLTHHHHDHVDGVPELVSKYAVPVFASNYDLSRLSFPCHGLKQGDQLSFQGSSFLVLEIPGHTLGHVAYHSPDEKMVFTGDTVFSLGCGRLFEGTPKQMRASLEKIKQLPKDTRIYFGHEYSFDNFAFLQAHHDLITTEISLDKIKSHLSEQLRLTGATTPSTVGFEADNNPFFRLNLADFTRLRELKNQW